MLQLHDVPTLAHLVRRIVGMDRSAAKAAFSNFLDDRSLNTQQIRFVELVIDQLTARGFMESAALYEPPFSGLHAGGPDELFAGKPNIIDGHFHTLEDTLPRVLRHKANTLHQIGQAGPFYSHHFHRQTEFSDAECQARSASYSTKCKKAPTLAAYTT